MSLLNQLYKLLTIIPNRLKKKWSILSYLVFAVANDLIRDNFRKLIIVLAELDAIGKEVGVNIKFGKIQLLTNLILSERSIRLQ